MDFPAQEQSISSMTEAITGGMIQEQDNYRLELI